VAAPDYPIEYNHHSIKPRVIYDEIEVKIHVSGSKDKKIPALSVK